MHTSARRAVLAFVVLLEYLVVAGLVFAAAMWVGQSESGNGPEGGTYLVLGIVVVGAVVLATGFVAAIVTMFIRERLFARLGVVSPTSAGAIVGRATFAAAVGGLWAVLLLPIVLSVGAMASIWLGG